jgi:ferrous iron transport protein B
MAIEVQAARKKIILVGNPNVGKSVIFRLLTGSYVLVSNFPGTTVEISRGKMQLGGIDYEVVDTPGINSLVPQSEDERVTAEVILREKPDVIIQVADAKNLRRTLLITSQLVEFGIPMVLVLNMMDEAEERGIVIDAKGVSECFSIPLVETVAIYSKGRKQLLQAIQNVKVPQDPMKMRWERHEIFAIYRETTAAPYLLAIEWLSLVDRPLRRAAEEALGTSTMGRLERISERYHSMQHKSLARDIAENRTELLDQWMEDFKKKREKHFVDEHGSNHSRLWLSLLLVGLLVFAWNELGGIFKVPTPFSFAIDSLTKLVDAHLESASASSPTPNLFWSLLFGKSASGRYEYGVIPEIVHFLLLIVPVVVPFGFLLTRNRRFSHEFGILTRRAATGLPILLAVLLLVYEFVGYTGAQTLVGLLEKTVFGQFLIPLLRESIPSGFIADLLLGKYGLISMGLTYALAIVLPVVGTFFIAFGLLEDSGYLPRLSILSDRLMRSMGLNGKATLPMVLGLGCCTMATMTTRILNSKKERLIATLLLALGIPCSAQLGVILGIAAGFSPMATITVIGVVASQLLLVGYLSSLLIGGQCSEFIFEIPPIRTPQLKNVLLKTGYRVQWYLKEALPLFLYGTLALFILDKVQAGGRSLLLWIEKAFEPVISGVLHLPSQSAGVFVLGFLRRDYGAAGLFEMTKNGSLSVQQAVVSLIVITLFVPCLASFLVIVKEHGIKWALAITGFIIPFAISVGGVVSWTLRMFNIQFH